MPVIGVPAEMQDNIDDATRLLLRMHRYNNAHWTEWTDTQRALAGDAVRSGEEMLALMKVQLGLHSA